MYIASLCYTRFCPAQDPIEQEYRQKAASRVGFIADVVTSLCLVLIFAVIGNCGTGLCVSFSLGLSLCIIDCILYKAIESQKTSQPDPIPEVVKTEDIKTDDVKVESPKEAKIRVKTPDLPDGKEFEFRSDCTVKGTLESISKELELEGNMRIISRGKALNYQEALDKDAYTWITSFEGSNELEFFIYIVCSTKDTLPQQKISDSV